MWLKKSSPRPFPLCASSITPGISAKVNSLLLIKLDDLISYLYKKNKSRTFMKLKLPFYIHKVGAGFPSPATDYIEDDVDLNSHLIKNAPATFIIRVQGRSMNNVGIYDGDLLVVDRSIDPKNLSTVIANVNEELVVKTFLKGKA